MKVGSATRRGFQKPTSHVGISNPDNSLQILETAFRNKIRKFKFGAAVNNVDFTPIVC